MPIWLQPEGWGPLCIASLALVAAFSWAVFRRPKPELKLWRARLRQAGILLLNMVLALVVVGLGLNKQNLWYPTWQSMWSTPSVVEENQVGEPAAPTTEKPWDIQKPTELQLYPEKNPAFEAKNWHASQDGIYLEAEAPGSGIGNKNTKLLIWLPPSYLKNPNRFYPVIVAFPGVPGSVKSYQSVMKIGEEINKAVGKRDMREAIVVSPDVFYHNVDTECVNSSDGNYQVEKYLTTGLYPWLKKNLRIVDDKNAWATLGYSAGGWCASMMALKHPDQYGYGISMSGYFWPTFDGKAFRKAGDPEYDLPTIAQKKKPATQIWFVCAKNDYNSYEQWKKFSKKVTKPTGLTSVFVDKGGHSWSVWHAATPKAFAWLGKSSAQFAWRAS